MISRPFTKKQLAKQTLLALAILSGTTFLNTTPTMPLVGEGMTVSADEAASLTTNTTTHDYTKDAQSTIDNATGNHDEYASVQDVTFIDSKGNPDPEAAVAGKWVNLKTVTGVAKDGNQSIDYKVNNVFVRKDKATNSLIAAYVGGKTQITITPRGSNNSVWVEIGKRSQDDGMKGTFRIIQKYYTGDKSATSDTTKTVTENGNTYSQTSVKGGKSKDTPLSFTLPDAFTTTDDTLRVAYTSNKSDGASGNDVAYPTPKIQMRNQSDLTTELAAALKSGDQSKQAKAEATKKLEQYRIDLKSDVDKDNTLDSQTKETKKKDIDTIIDQAEKDIAEKDNAQDVDDIVARAVANAQDAHKNPTMADRIKAAEAAISLADQQMRSSINDNKDLSQSEKDALLAQVTADTQKLTKAVESANNQSQTDEKGAVDSLNNTLNGLLKDSTGTMPAYQDVKITAAESFDQRKGEAATTAKNQYDAATEAINANTTLTAAEKKERIAQLNKDYQSNLDAISKATMASDFDAAATTFSNAITADTKGADQSLDDQKNALIQKIESSNDIQAKLDQIKGDPTLDEKEKQTQTDALNTSKAKLEEHIRNAQDAQAAIDATTDETTKALLLEIDQAHQANAAVADQIQQAQAAIQAKAQSQKDVIDQLTNLTSVLVCQ